MPAKYDITVWQGNTFTRTFAFKDAANAAVNLTGATVIFRLAPIKTGAYAAIRKSTASSPTVGTGDVLLSGLRLVGAATAGTIELALNPAETRTVELSKSGKYEIEVRWANGRQETLVYGDVTAEGGVNDDE